MDEYPQKQKKYTRHRLWVKPMAMDAQREWKCSHHLLLPSTGCSQLRGFREIIRGNIAPISLRLNSS